MLKNKTALSLSPLALLTLAACGGSTSGAGTQSVVAQKGPLNLAAAYLDYDDDGVWDKDSEPGALTGVDGTATISLDFAPSSGQITAGYDLKIAGNANTMDMSSNTVFDNVLSAPSNSTMITPVTTMVAETGLTAAQVVKVLGLPAGLDPLTFNAFSTTLSDADKLTALKVEKTSQKTMAILETFETAAASSGAPAAVAAKAALDSVVLMFTNASTAYETADALYLADQALATPLGVAAPTAVTFSPAQVTAVQTNMAAEVLAKLTTAQQDVYNTQVAKNVTSLQNVVATIAAIDETDVANLDLAASTDIFSVVSVLMDQVKTATDAVLAIQAANTANGTTNALVTQNMLFEGAGATAALLAAVSNPGPTDMTLSSLTISEGASSLVVGTVTTTDTSDAGTAEVVAVTAVTADLANGIAGVTGVTAVAAVPGTVETGHTYSIVAGVEDASLFSIDAATGVLSLIAQPDYETKASYTVAIKTTEAGASKKSYVETFTIAVTDVAESGGFGISSDIVTYTDYDVTTSTSITNQLATKTTGTNVTFGDAVPMQLNSLNMTNLTDGNALTIGATPVLSFTLDTVPTGSGTATVTATITDGTYTAGSAAVAANLVTGAPAVARVAGAWSTDGTRAGAEDQISVTVNVSYFGDGTTATITAASGTALSPSATGSYNNGEGTSATFNINNMATDAFSITAANAVTGQPASLDVKMAALYEAFVSGAGHSNMIVDGQYHLNISTTLPLENAANETVTNFSGRVELSNDTPMNTIIGTNGADTLVGTAAAEIFALGYDTDTVTTGGGADFIVLDASEGRTLANIDTVTDFSNGTDKFYLAENLTFAELTIAAATDTADTLVSITASGEYLMLISDVPVGLINSGDFMWEVI